MYVFKCIECVQMSLAAALSAGRSLLMSPSQKGPSLTALGDAEVFGVRNPCLFSLIPHLQSSGGQGEAGSRTSVQR